MAEERPGTTPHPPPTAEFGSVEPGGPAHAYEPRDGMAVTKFSVGPFDNNVYIVRCEQTNKALIIDGATDPERILTEAKTTDVVAIVQTHAHPDHVQALEGLVAALKIPVYAHTGEGRLPVRSEPLGDGSVVRVGALEISVWHTPGHTRGSLSFVAPGFLFSGDTLFPGGPGRTTSRPYFRQIMESVERMVALGDDTQVCPGHGLDTTIGRERQYVETWRARGW